MLVAGLLATSALAAFVVAPSAPLAFRAAQDLQVNGPNLPRALILIFLAVIIPFKEILERAVTRNVTEEASGQTAAKSPD